MPVSQVSRKRTENLFSWTCELIPQLQWTSLTLEDTAKDGIHSALILMALSSIHTANRL